MTVTEAAPDRNAASGQRHEHRMVQVAEWVIFNYSRSLLVAFYIAVSVMLTAFVAHAVYDSYLFITSLWHGESEAATIGMLSGLDNMMIANVIYLIAAGSYVVYVRDKLENSTFETHGQRPQALRRLTPGALKEKMAASLVGVSSVNLLQVLINVGVDERSMHINWIVLTAKVGIHLTLLTGLLSFAKTNYWEALAERLHGPATHDAKEPTHE